MFSRFRNLFSKAKDDTVAEVSANSVESLGYTSDNVLASSNNTSEDTSKLEGLNFLKSIVESEQGSSSATGSLEQPASLSQEVAELLEKRLSQDEGQISGENGQINGFSETNKPENIQTNGDVNGLKEESKEIEKPSNEDKDIASNNSEEVHQTSEIPNNDRSENISEHNKREGKEDKMKPNDLTSESRSHDIREQKLKEPIELCIIEEDEVKSNENKTDSQSDKVSNQNEEDIRNENKISETSELETIVDPKINISETKNSENEPLEEKVSTEPQNLENPLETTTSETKSQKSENSQSNEISKPTDSQDLNNSHKTNTNESLDSHENSPELSESSKSISQSSIKENPATSTSQTSTEDLVNNISNNSSIVVEDIPSEITTPSPTVEGSISGTSSNTSTLDSSTLNESHDPSKIIVNPIDSNGLACNAINNKLTDIAEVAESLDAIIREVQENVQASEVGSNPSPRDKKLDTLRSTSSDDWHSRSTEDDSFATASEGNFTPYSQSSASFQTASGRTSSFVSCDKNSFDASEADDSTYNFEMTELTSPLNMSFEGSEQSYVSAQTLNREMTPQDQEKTPTKSQTLHFEEDQSSIADIEELHSESVTPTPGEHYDGYHVDSIPVESETELEVAGIVNNPSLQILTEHTVMPLSKTPEVSSPTSSSNVCSNQNPSITTDLTVNEAAAGSNVEQDQQNTNKPNAAWRRSKYYENITKQTIKGFL